ncbi:MAG TPA: transposase [Mycobacteriales bacterium]|nr:transposase [Mycobacteriales bacterium]
MRERILWSVDDALYIRTRSNRYSDAVDVQPAWTQEALNDPDLIAFEPDPKSRIGASRFIGESPSAGRLLVIIAYRDLDGVLHGVNAWPASGIDRTFYERSTDDG